MPRGIMIPVIYRDEYLLAINKPAGLLCHPTGQYQGDTLISRLRHCLKADVRLVHRLDQNTSGAMVVALRTDVVPSLYRQFEKYRVQKHYLALVCGKMSCLQGDIRLPLVSSQLPTDAIKIKIKAVLQEGSAIQGQQDACTHYQVLEASDHVSLLQVTAHSGRKHQIRVHLASVGHPLIGELMYRHAGLPFLWEYYCHRPSPWHPPIRGHGLHAYSLELIHPVHKHVIGFTASLPEDWKHYLASVGLRMF